MEQAAKTQFIIRDEALLDSAIEELTVAAGKPRFTHHGPEMVEERYAVLPPTASWRERLERAIYASSDRNFSPLFLNSPSYSKLVPLYVERLVARGRVDQARRLLDLSFQVLVKRMEETDSLHALWMLQSMAQTLNGAYFDVPAMSGEPAKVAAARQRDEDLAAFDKYLTTQHGSLWSKGWEERACKNVAFFGMFAGSGLADASVFAPSRRAEYLAAERLGVAVVSVFLGALVLLSILAAWRWRRKGTGSDGPSPMLLVPSWRKDRNGPRARGRAPTAGLYRVYTD